MAHEKKHASERDLAQKIESYIAELEEVAFDANRSRSESGVIVRNRIGEIRVLKTTLHSNVSSLFLAEAFTCLQAIKLGISLGLRSVTIRGDSKTIIKKCQSAEMDKSIIGAIMKDIKSHSSLFQEIDFQFIQKSKNFQAHKIAKEALANGEERYLVRDESIYNEGAMEEEWSRNPD
uniref:RNase H type-1 domain-containing protein n=1 Tax=Gossypium raimondii TaxID=29730 RepID=A0A0D2M4X5_GOSRA|nr:hypothetical protein B456_002G004100 [Gossypium raimondii]